MATVIERIFNNQFTDAQGIVHQTWITTLKGRERAAMDAAIRLLDYFNKDRDAIVEHCKVKAAQTFDDVEGWQYPPLNFVARTIKRLSLAFRNPPDWVVVDDAGEPIDDPDGKLVDTFTKTLFRGVDILEKLKTMDQYATLMNTVLVEPVWRNGAIDWDIHMRSNTIVIPDPENYLAPAKVAIAWCPMNVDTLETRDGWIYWTPTEHSFMDESGQTFGMSDPDGKNPYGIIPMTVIRKLEQNEFWGRLGADVVDANEAALVLLADIWETMIFQSFGQALFTNCGINDGDTIKLGPKNPFVAEKITTDMVPPSIQFITPDTDTANVMDQIDRYIKQVGACYSLPPGSWSLDEQRQSGFAKFMDNIELLENRDDDIPSWTRTIMDLVEKSRLVHNHFAPLNKGEVIPDGMYLMPVFPPASFPESPTEKSTRIAMDIGMGLYSAVRYHMDENGLDEDAAMERAMQDAEWNRVVATAAMPDIPGFGDDDETDDGNDEGKSNDDNDDGENDDE